LETRNISLWSALFLGVFVSAVGVRTLGMLVAENAVPAGMQTSLFNSVDILLTGALLAGGSDGIHKIMQVYTNYMESAASKARG